MAFEEMLLFNLLDLSVLKPYHLLMLNFCAPLLTKLTWAAAFLSLCFTLLRRRSQGTSDSCSWEGKSTMGSGHQRMGEGNLFLGEKDSGSTCSACQEQGSKHSDQAAKSFTKGLGTWQPMGRLEWFPHQAGWRTFSGRAQSPGNAWHAFTCRMVEQRPVLMAKLV